MSQSSQQSFWQAFFLDTWYHKRWWAWLLLPVAWLYQLLSFVHAYIQKKKMVHLSVPVIVIGNISVGGTGKTPVIIALAKALTAQGITVGIISRGYGSDAPHYPYTVQRDSDNAHVAGDEPLMLAQATQCPVVIGKDRVAAARALLQAYPQVDVLLSDDGLQHYRLGRDIEVVVVDGERGLGNHFCLPAGPLREPAKRLASVDWVLRHQEHMAPSITPSVVESSDNTSPRLFSIALAPTAWRHVTWRDEVSQSEYPLQPLPWLASNSAHTPVMMAGIGHPQRFFNTLRGMDIDGDTVAFDDHYQYTNNDFALWQERVVLMTEKDAVKCHAIEHPHMWSLQVAMVLPDAFITGIVQQLGSPVSHADVTH
jgi:tetraacyldisaccharide 4'-kinase